MAQLDSDLSGSGRLLGPYQVRERIGVGGMGEVYRALDTKLGRDVAIKILPPRSMSDPETLFRFKREARLLAALNHPNIGAIYGFEIDGDVHAIILELIEGDTLADRIRPGPLPLKNALAIALQIADALDAAHSKGIVHRDLKPANVKITSDSVVKVLDFGLAKVATGHHDSDNDLEGSTALSLDGTRIGTILGTPAYMSPEQARGENVDKRTDIWAFGCLLYQMLTGRNPFGRETMMATLAAIAESEPDLTLLPANIPPGVRRLLARCLEKDPRRRLRDIADGIASLDEPVNNPLQVVTPGRNTTHASLKWWTLAAAICAVIVAAFLLRSRPDPAIGTNALLRTTIDLPLGAKLVSGTRELPLAIAPDGSRIAYVAEKEGRRLLYLRDMSGLEAHAIPGTEDARHPFFSPDSQSIGYFAGGALQRIAVGGGSPQRICDTVGISSGGSWGRDHTIVFAMTGSDLMRVHDSGGTPQILSGTKPAAWPEILPGGKAVLFTTSGTAFATIPIAGGATHVFASLANSLIKGPSILGSGGTLLQAHVVSSGYLLYGQSPGVVLAAPFDLSSMSITGPPVSLAASIERAMNGGGVYFAVSQTGLLVYAATGNQHQLAWVDPKGNATPVTPDRAPYRQPRLSPDGRLIAVAISDDTRRADIWIIDVDRGTRRRITTQDHNLAPTWSPDGSRIAFSSKHGIGEVPANGGPGNNLVETFGAYPASWSPDGKNLLYSVDLASGSAMWMLTPGTSGSPPGHIVAQDSTYKDPQYSPDGRWIAYTRYDSLRSEVYIAHAPDLVDPVPVSNNGGLVPIWSKDGHDLFYREGDAMMKVSVDTAHGLHAGKPERLFSGDFSGESHDNVYDVTRDEQRFLMVKSDPAATLTKLTVVQNWQVDLKK